MAKDFLKFFSGFLFPVVVEERKSEVSGMLKVVSSRRKYMLETERANYSFGGLHDVFRKAFSDHNIRQREMQNALILGFGSGSVASILEFEYGKQLEITGVEKDPVVIELTEKYFSPEAYSNLSVKCADAFDFVVYGTGKYDLVVMDVYINLDVPGKFSDDRFIKGLGNMLSEKGILFYNLVIHNEKLRDKGAQLFNKLNALAGPTEWLKIADQDTENWIFVLDRSGQKRV